MAMSLGLGRGPFIQRLVGMQHHRPDAGKPKIIYKGRLGVPRVVFKKDSMSKEHIELRKAD